MISTMGRPSALLSEVLPPLICGTATFTSQYNPDPYALPTTAIVHRALSLGVRAFDTSPYYGPAEELLGHALNTDLVCSNFPRDSYYLSTKVGRIAASSFDYSPSWIRQSVRRSLRRLHTSYLDVVYCHDVEFVTPQEVLVAVQELRKIRDLEGTIKYVGISGYPVNVLCDLAELVLRETGEPLDAVMSYANFTLQNTRLLSEGLPRLVAAGVDIVPNASPLGMGLLRRRGVPVGNMGDWHPAPDSLRQSIHAASDWAEGQGEKLEVVAIRFALETWLREGREVGCRGAPLAHELTYGTGHVSSDKLGVSVMGVSKLEELDETMRVWRSVLDGLADDLDEDPGTMTPGDASTDHEWSLKRRHRIRFLAAGIRKVLGSWVDYTWDSPEKGFVNHAPVMDNSTEATASLPTSTAAEPSEENPGVLLTPPMDEVMDSPNAGDEISECGDL